MKQRDTIVQAHFTKQPSGKTGTFDFDLQKLVWLTHGPGGLAGLRPEARDILELVRVVHEIDRRSPRRIASDRIRTVTLHMSLRRPAVWSTPLQTRLAEMLSMMSNVEWAFAFRKRKGKTQLDEKGEVAPAPAEIRKVVLFSGGLDSASGLCTLRNRPHENLLLSYYTRNLEKQRRLAHSLGFPAPLQVQGTLQNPFGARAGGQFWYRSLLFVTIAAIVADGLGANEVLQFENGPLAWAVPPQPIYRMTRHAHPEFHRTVGAIVSEVLGRQMTVSNPFLTATKREVVFHMRKTAKSTAEFRQIVALTETCWSLLSPRIHGSIEKRVGQPCGACIPCIVRRTALQADDVPSAADLTSPRGRHSGNPIVRLHVSALRSFSATLTAPNYSWPEFMSTVPAVTGRAWIMNTANVSAVEGFSLYQRFAREFLETYAWDIPA